MTKRLFRSLTTVGCTALLFALTAHGQTRTENAKLDPSDPIAFQTYGSRVAFEGDTAVIGAPRENRTATGGPRDEGAAYVYRRGTTANPCPGDADWCEEAKLTPVFTTEINKRIRLGTDVDISGDTIVASASRWGDSNSRIGKVFIYRRDPGLSVCGDPWCIERELLATDGMASDNFGINVAIDGDTLFVSTRADTVGSVYVYTRSGTTWTEQDELTPPTADPFQNFGNNLALDGDTLLVGALGDSTPVMGDPTDYTNAGAAYIYTKVAGTWTLHSKLQASDRRAMDQFGTGTGLSGDTAIIGAPRRIDNACQGGAAYFFTLVGGVWQEQVKVLSPNGLQDDCYGFNAAVSGNTAIIPADLEDTPGTNSGAAYIYTGSGASWTLANRMAPANAQAWDTFGWDVALDGNTAVLGAPAFGDPAFNRSGSAYVYELDRAETPLGDDVTVAPLPLDENGDPVPNGPPTTLQFAQVTDTGNTTVVITDTAPPLPAGFRVGGLSGEAAYFDINTEAEFVPPVVICIDYSSLTLEGDPADLTLAHEEGGVWVDKTISNDPVAMILCGETNTFSLFAVLGMPSADSLLTDLSDAVAQLDAGKGTINSLTAKLMAAQAKLGDGNANNGHAANNMLQAFINAVEAQRGKKISDAEADLLVQGANEILQVIDGVSL